MYRGHTHYYQATMLVIVINCLRLLLLSFIVTMVIVVMGYQATMLVIVLRLFAVVILLLPWRWAACVYKLKRPYAVFSLIASDGRHVCTKYHGHTYFYQQL